MAFKVFNVKVRPSHIALGVKRCFSSHSEQQLLQTPGGVLIKPNQQFVLGLKHGKNVQFFCSDMIIQNIRNQGPDNLPIIVSRSTLPKRERLCGKKYKICPAKFDTFEDICVILLLFNRIKLQLKINDIKLFTLMTCISNFLKEFN